MRIAARRMQRWRRLSQRQGIGCWRKEEVHSKCMARGESTRRRVGADRRRWLAPQFAVTLHCTLTDVRNPMIDHLLLLSFPTHHQCPLPLPISLPVLQSSDSQPRSS